MYNIKCLNERFLLLRFVACALVCIFQACSQSSNSMPVANSADPTMIGNGHAKILSYENYIETGLQFAKEKHFTEAANAYQHARDLNPKAPLAWNNLCANDIEEGKFAEALELCEIAVKLDPSFAYPKNNLAQAKLKMRELQANVAKEKPEIFSKLSHMKNNELIDAGMVFFLARDLESAVAVWKRVPGGNPLYPMAQSNLASAYILKGDFEKASKAINEAITLEPNNQLFLNNRKWLEQKLDEKKR